MVAEWMSERLGRQVAYQRGRDYLQRLGARLRQPHPRHVAAGAEEQAAFKNGSAAEPGCCDRHAGGVAGQSPFPRYRGAGGSPDGALRRVAATARVHALSHPLPLVATPRQQTPRAEAELITLLRNSLRSRPLRWVPQGIPRQHEPRFDALASNSTPTCLSLQPHIVLRALRSAEVEQ